MKINSIIKINYLRAIEIFILELVSALAITYSSYIIINAYNLLSKNQLLSFLCIVVLSVFIQFLSTLFSSFATYLFSKQCQDYIHTVRDKIIKRYYYLSFNDATEMQNNLNMNLQILTNNFANPCSQILNSLLLIITSIGTLFVLNWRLVILTVILAIITLLIPKFVQDRTSIATKIISQKNVKYLNTVKNWFYGLDELRRYLSFNILDLVMREKGADLEKSYVDRQKVWSIAEFINGCTSSFSQIAIVIEAAFLFFRGDISFGAVVVSGNFASAIFGNVLAISTSLVKIHSTDQINNQIHRLQQFSVQRKPTPTKFNMLKTKKLSIRYSNGQKIRYPDISIKKGEKILLTGESGVGKSTLIKLLLGEIKPTTGEIIFQDDTGKALKASTLDIGYISQDELLFPGSIKENITMYDKNLDSKVATAIDAVQLTSDLSAMPEGSNKEIDLDLSNISGGQKQKIILARNLIRNYSVLLADEPISAVDRHASKLILENLLNSHQTLIMIAHNLDKTTRNLFDREIHLNKRDDNYDF